MQVKYFSYTKKDGSTSKRVVMVTKQPSNMLLGVDLTELESADVAMYAKTYSQLLDEFMASVAELNTEFDTHNRVRQFDPLKMTEIEDTWISYGE